jgi:hypothetical protein
VTLLTGACPGQESSNRQVYYTKEHRRLGEGYHSSLDKIHYKALTEREALDLHDTRFIRCNFPPESLHLADCVFLNMKNLSLSKLHPFSPFPYNMESPFEGNALLTISVQITPKRRKITKMWSNWKMKIRSVPQRLGSRKKPRLIYSQ